jgi:putative spermidine/putrescine transport system ATP-binding protein
MTGIGTSLADTRRAAADSAGPAAISVSRLVKAYGGPNAVDDISFELENGEFLTLLGPSGSGKTSTLMLIAGFEQPNSGDIQVRGKSILGYRPQDRNFGIVFQSYALFPHLSAIENVEFPLRMRRIPREQQRKKATEMLDKVGLADYAARRPRQLSGGQQQRVALARALVFAPDALLLDEPLGALDTRLREALQLELKAIQQREGTSVIFVTHDQNEAMTMSDRIAVMNEGRITQVGPPDEVYERPHSAFVANFLGETNLLFGTVASANGGRIVLTLRGGTDVLGCCYPTEDSPKREKDARLALRPEALRFVDPSGSHQNLLVGTVATRVFLGSAVRFTVDVAGQQPVIVRSVPPSPGDSPLPERGQRVGLAWPPDRGRLIAD